MQTLLVEKNKRWDEMPCQMISYTITNLQHAKGNVFFWISLSQFQIIKQ